MKRLFYFSFVLMLPGFLHAQTMFWQVYDHGIEQSAKDIITTADGGYILVGETRTANPGDSDVYILKTNNLGVEQWHKQYGGTSPDYPNSIVATADGNYLIVGFTESYGAGGMDIWLLKIDPSGN